MVYLKPNCTVGKKVQRGSQAITNVRMLASTTRSGVATVFATAPPVLVEVGWTELVPEAEPEAVIAPLVAVPSARVEVTTGVVEERVTVAVPSSTVK
jgi:hypothetical protein